MALAALLAASTSLRAAPRALAPRAPRALAPLRLRIAMMSAGPNDQGVVYSVKKSAGEWAEQLMATCGPSIYRSCQGPAAGGIAIDGLAVSGAETAMSLCESSTGLPQPSHHAVV